MWTNLLAYVLLIISCSAFAESDPKVPCYFIFGDSLSDAGNNNDLVTDAKANYPPYGVDFVGSVATGRFTNGLTTSDILTRYLGIQGLITAFSSTSGAEILKGVNYASAAAGILSESGSHLGDRIWFARQVQNHGITISKLQSYVKGPVSDYLNKCLYTVNIGNDDYINNYFLPQFYSTNNDMTPDVFASALVSEYEQQIKALYDYGARKTAIFGLGLLGCLPAEILKRNAIQCAEDMNEAAQVFNIKLIRLVHSLNIELIDANFTYIGIADMNNLSPLSLGDYGITADVTCCTLKSNYQCDSSAPACPDRNLYSFMDGYHPTQIINELTARLSFNSPSNTLAHPVDIYTLVHS